MSKTIFVSNRLPITIKKNKDGFSYVKSIGGLATGLSGYHQQADSLWIGWPGLAAETLSGKEMHKLEKELLEKHKCMPVHLSQGDVDKFYYGFCNNTIWPLFHYFTNKVEYDKESWKAYKKVNQLFYDKIAPVIEEGDTIWIHDYQLMLLPKMIKEKFKDTKIGFFLHIPFPSFEIFRLLIWRKEILYGLLGSDLIGFHTYGYVRHFLRSVRRLLGYEFNLNRIAYENRYVQVDAFPMGIDYDRFSKDYDTEQFRNEVEKIVSTTKGEKLILSIDRLDYTKGIPGRIKAFGEFLKLYPEYREKVRFHLIVAPSRVEVEAYENLRSEIAKLVSEINGKYGTVDWMPIWFYFQTFSQESLIALYKYSDVLLVTPLRDGMNLVSKEYIAAKTDKKGMVVISETAGAASELGEAVVVNANDIHAIAKGIKTALEMPDEDKIAINDVLNKRLKRYDVHRWAEEFLKSIDRIAKDNQLVTTCVDDDDQPIIDAYHEAEKRLIFLDYDGTLVGFKSIPKQAKPDVELKQLLYKLTEDSANTVVVVSGRDHHTLEEWLGDLRLDMIASHGLWRRERDGQWSMTASLDNSWKETVAGIMQTFVDRMPGALIEEKEYSLAFHYRQCEPDMISVKLGEVRAALFLAIQSLNLGIQEGNKVLEIKDNRVNKGLSASTFFHDEDFDFMLGVGDDHTDEDLFAALPEDAFTIKVGMDNTNAKYRLKSWRSMRKLLKDFTN